MTGAGVIRQASIPLIKPSNVWRAFVNTLLVLSFLMSMLVSGGSVIPTLLGMNTMVVTSGSMVPSIGVGDAVIVDPSFGDRVSIGDVVTFRSSQTSGMVTHRVIASREIGGQTYYQTKGDANQTPDPNLVWSGAVYGKVRTHLPWLGYLIVFSGTLIGKLVIIAVPLTILMAREFGSLKPNDDLSEDDADQTDATVFSTPILETTVTS